ncbi:hypothetical protein AR679_gp145 [Yellowstone lake phycodnavirus 1]|uniref:hypothetical protein n=1 Tax=Yellowstone lake phycodnavirus 1 TaxID=1586713 RepID=UPI0006EB8A7A|nr:hypothetical protein AR679_gp145 [Yellowstone lake phycodnavirus 1]BAT22171.1 hypothetical protein [Yellowstone lake phycodnavirus 1]
MIRDWLVPKAPGTHVLMDGGILSVDEHDVVQFYTDYISEIKSGNKLYVVEQKTDVFKFFVDIDYKANEKMTDEFLLQICRIIHEAIDGPGRCCVARAVARPVKEGIKSGVHIHWPDLMVNRQQATVLRTRILLADLPEGHDWAKIIDASVYGGSGLRMIWSHKKPSGDPYVPWKEIVSMKDFPKEPSVELLSLFCIRCPGEEANGSAMFGEETLSSEPIEEFIQSDMPGQRRTHVKKIQKFENGARQMWWVQTDSKYCEKIRDEHKSNHVWFMINGDRISQKCFNDECKDFAGKEHILPPSIVDGIVVVGSPPRCSGLDLFPEGIRRSVPEVRERSSSIFGS